MLCFSNPGALPLACITVSGASVKSDGAIGRFGTGLKYALAGIMRLNGEVEIISDSVAYQVGIEPLNIKGQYFNEVCLYQADNPPIHCGFVDTLGHHWEPWQWYRELRANAQDEGGEVTTEAPDFYPHDRTFINVRCPELEAEHAQAHKHFLPAIESLWQNAQVAIFPPQKNFHVAYQGIRMANGSAAQTSLYTYSLLSHQDLTEDRTLANPHAAKVQIVQALLACDDETILRPLLCGDFQGAKSHYLEYSLDFDWPNNPPSPTFARLALEQLARKAPSFNMSVRDALRRINAKEVDRAEQAMPSTWEEAQRGEPKVEEIFETSHLSSLAYAHETILTQQTKRADYWKAIAEEFFQAKAQGEADQANYDSQMARSSLCDLDDEISF